MEVYVRPFPMTAAKWRVSTSGGKAPVWGPDGHELFFMDLDQKAKVAKITYEPSFDAGVPTDIPSPSMASAFDVLATPAGLRFVAYVPCLRAAPRLSPSFLAGPRSYRRNDSKARGRRRSERDVSMNGLLGPGGYRHGFI
jgi:hypothetical protein